MKNHTKFYDPIMFHFPIIQIEKLVRMTHNLFKKHMSNIIYDFLVLNIF